MAKKDKDTIDVAYVKGSDYVNVFINGASHTISEDHHNYEKIIQALKDEDFSDLQNLIDIVTSIKDFAEDNFEFKNGQFFYKGEVLDNTLTRRILEMMNEGFKATPMLNFLDNLLTNPSHRAVKELYTFLENHDLPITEDGHFLAYKKVKYNFLDIHSGTMDNSPGKVVEMERNLVDDDSNRTCSTGLHFCSKSYLENFGGNHKRELKEGEEDKRDKVVIVKVNPRDVVSIPKDYNASKVRCCRYEVLAEEKNMNKEDLAKSVLSN